VAPVLREIRSLLADRYDVSREIGRGGMAIVFAATQRSGGDEVAVKVIRPEIALTVGADRFLREIRIAARLSHPNILPVLDSGEISGLTYYVMPYVAGEALRTRLSRGGPLDVQTAVRIARDVASGLAHAHAAHIIHRDVKPGNILLSGALTYVMDFGVARAIDEAHTESITAPGIAVGTPAYMSPEQASGERHLDARSDIYSLGCVLYEMLSGEPPYTGATTHAIVMRCFSEPVPAVRHVRPEVPPYVDGALQKALAKLPIDRFATAAEFAESLSPTAAVAGAPRRTSVAVLPFRNLGSDPDDAYLSDGLTEEIISHLGKLESVRVAARTSSFAFRESGTPPETAGRRLGVSTVLDGSVRRTADRLEVEASLVRATDGQELWRERYDREMADVFAIQEDIAGAIVATLEGHLETSRPRRVVRRYTESLTAFELYLRGRYEGRHRSRHGLLRGIEFFERAVSADPHYALAYVGLADFYSLMAWYRFQSPREAFPRAGVAAMRALERDDLLSQAHASLGAVRFYHQWDWGGAERAITRALELHPDEPTGLHVYGEFLLAQGRLGEALEHATRAREADPLAANINAGIGWVHYFAREFDRAITQFQRTLALDPGYAFLHWFLGQSQLAAGDLDGALATLRSGAVSSNRHTAMEAYLGYVYARTGEEQRARAALAELRSRAASEYVPADCLAVLHLGLGERDEALVWLERAVGERALHVVFLGVDPMFDELRDDGRFQGLLQSVGLA
jgi:serine/threonine-protein kinase